MLCLTVFAKPNSPIYKRVLLLTLLSSAPILATWLGNVWAIPVSALYVAAGAFIWCYLPWPLGLLFLFVLLLGAQRVLPGIMGTMAAVPREVFILDFALTMLTSMSLAWLLAWNRGRLLEHSAALANNRLAATKLAEANIRLQDYATRIEDMAKTEERTRMARDMHDILAHTLTSMIVQIGACERMIPVEPERAVAELARVREVAVEGLGEVRATIVALRTPLVMEGKGRESWTKLALAFADITKMKISVDISEDFEVIDDELNEAIYRVIQEGLTNAYRHGHAENADLAVWWDKGLLMVRISDDGDGVEKVSEGYGLRGMRERVERFGGSIAWRSRVGRGFDLGMEIPVRGSGNSV